MKVYLYREEDCGIDWTTNYCDICKLENDDIPVQILASWDVENQEEALKSLTNWIKTDGNYNSDIAIEEVTKDYNSIFIAEEAIGLSINAIELSINIMTKGRKEIINYLYDDGYIELEIMNKLITVIDNIDNEQFKFVDDYFLNNNYLKEDSKIKIKKREN